MRAADLAQPLPLVVRDRSVADAGRVIADHGRIGVVVCDRSGTPIGMITALDVFRLALPDYLVDDPSLAATLDEHSIADLIERLRRKTVGEVIEDGSVRLRPVPTVDAEANVLEVAAVLVSAGTTVAVVAGDPDRPRFVTLPTVLDAIVVDAGRGPADAGTDGPV
jgi:CBS domain-containing protein